MSSDENANKSGENSELLQFVITIHRAEMERHQSLINNIFYWTVTIVLGIGIASVQLAGSAAWHTLPRQWPLRLAASTITLFVTGVAITEMIKRVAAYDSNARVVAKTSILLRLFDSDVFTERHEPLYEAAWKDWGNRNHPAHKFLPWFHSVVLVVLGLGVSILLWTN